MDFSAILTRTCNNVRGHVAMITKTESTYVLIESTLQFDDVKDIPGLLLLLRQFKSHVCGQFKKTERETAQE